MSEARKALREVVATLVPATKEQRLSAKWIVVSCNTFLAVNEMRDLLPGEVAMVRFTVHCGVGEHDMFQVSHQQA